MLFAIIIGNEVLAARVQLHDFAGVPCCIALPSWVTSFLPRNTSAGERPRVSPTDKAGLKARARHGRRRGMGSRQGQGKVGGEAQVVAGQAWSEARHGWSSGARHGRGQGTVAWGKVDRILCN